MADRNGMTPRENNADSSLLCFIINYAESSTCSYHSFAPWPTFSS